MLPQSARCSLIQLTHCDEWARWHQARPSPHNRPGSGARPLPGASLLLALKVTVTCVDQEIVVASGKFTRLTNPRDLSGKRREIKC